MTTETDTTVTVTILADRAVAALKALKKLAKKAERYDVPFAYDIGETRLEKREEQTDDMFYPHGVRKYTVTVLDITLTAEAPVVGDYQFLASVEFTGGDAGNYIDTVPGATLPPDYRTTDQRCEHCHASRARKHVFVVRNRADGTLLQVGRTCLRDFLGTDNPGNIIGAFGFFRDLSSFGELERWDDFGGNYFAADIRRALAITSAAIRVWGWTSKGQAWTNPDVTPTVSRYWDFVDKPNQNNAETKRKIKEELRESDFDLAGEIMDYVRTSTDQSDYMHNLRIAFADDVIGDPKRMGLAVSGVSAYHRHVDRALKRQRDSVANKDSRHQGAIGERLRAVTVRLESRRGMGDNGYGWTELLKMRDGEGNLYSWFTGAGPSVDIGEEVTIDGTVKAHREWANTAETQLTRVKVK